jgi:hypothetical protein
MVRGHWRALHPAGEQFGLRESCCRLTQGPRPSWWLMEGAPQPEAEGEGQSLITV